MVLNNNLTKMSETSVLLGCSEEKVFELLKYSFLSGRNIDGEMYVVGDSINKYIDRFGKEEVKPKKSYDQVRNFSIAESVDIIGSEEEVHRLIQRGSLKAGMVNGDYVVYGNSMRSYAKGEV